VVWSPWYRRANVGGSQRHGAPSSPRWLDLPAKRDMWSLLRRLAATESVTTFLSRGDAQEIRPLCSEISVIAKGRLVHSGPTREMGGDIDAFEDRLILIAMLTPP
jgi:ABC-type multidrug transport system ATPase subunit